VTSTPRYALCEIAFPDTTLAQDIEIAQKSGATGLSVDEAKMSDRDPRDVAADLTGAGIQAAACIPSVMSFLPGPGLRGSNVIDERVEAMCAGIRRLAVLKPTSILCLTGPRGSYSPAEARRLALIAMRQVADVAAEVGVPLSFETFRRVEPQNYSIVFGLEEAIDFLAEAGHPDISLCYDTWHVWDSSPRILERSSPPSGGEGTTAGMTWKSSPTTAASGTTTPTRCGSSRGLNKRSEATKACGRPGVNRSSMVVR
jgi:sugar phosphate isomerase/epimerase